MDDAWTKTATALLVRLADGDRDASEELYSLVYDELRVLAQGLMRGQPERHTLQATALVHEAWLRLDGGARGGLAFEHRRQFYALAAKVMRSVLVDHARSRGAAKRGGGRALSGLDGHEQDPAAGASADPAERMADVLALHEALERLAAVDERLARVVELRYFGGLSNAETGHVLGIAERTVEDDARLARAWLRAELER